MAEQPLLAERSDESLMAAVACGDAEEFAALYDRYAPHAYAISLRIVRRASDAEAVLSEVFTEIWEKPDRYHPDRGAFRTYFMTLVRSRSIDCLRSSSARTARERAVGLEEGRRRPGTDQVDPADRAIRGENAQRLASALDELSDLQQRALRLAYFEGLTHREIADRLTTPLGTVKTAIRQGLIRLRATLGDLPDGDENDPPGS